MLIDRLDWCGVVKGTNQAIYGGLKMIQLKGNVFKE